MSEVCPNCGNAELVKIGEDYVCLHCEYQKGREASFR